MAKSAAQLRAEMEAQIRLSQQKVNVPKPSQKKTEAKKQASKGSSGASPIVNVPGLGLTDTTMKRARPSLNPTEVDQAKDRVQPVGGQNLVVGYELRPPHTLRTAAGKPCRTDRWFDRIGLVYDASQPDDGPMGFNNPRMYLAGSTFRVYYPNSTRTDFASCMSSGSSGRWLHSWSQKSSYIHF